MTEHREFEDGEIIPGTRYRVLRLIGVGGMGSVYDVEHVELGKRFVLKALLRELTRREDLAQRLRNEWRALGRLQHENIVNVTDAGTSSSGVPYYVMERLDGDTLATVLRNRRRLHVLEAVAIAAAVLEALSAAHEIGVIHRDVKPANIFIVKGGGVKLLDFGIAKIADASSVVTARGLAVGTPRYMSPEQARGERVDGRSDVYATGLILFEMIAGVGPFDDARDANELLLAHLAREVPPLSSLVMGVSPELEGILVSMLAKDCRSRPSHARQVAAQLREFALRQHSAPATDAPTNQALYGSQMLAAARRVTPNPLHSVTTHPENAARVRSGTDFTPSDAARTQRFDPTTLTVHSAPSFELSSVPDTTFVSSPAFDGSSTTLELPRISSASNPSASAAQYFTQGFPAPSSGAFVERPERTEILGEYTPPPSLDAVATRTQVPVAERPVSVTPPPVVDTARSQLTAVPSRRGKLVAGALLGLLLVGGIAVRAAQISSGAHSPPRAAERLPAVAVPSAPPPGTGLAPQTPPSPSSAPTTPVTAVTGSGPASASAAAPVGSPSAAIKDSPAPGPVPFPQLKPSPHAVRTPLSADSLVKNLPARRPPGPKPPKRAPESALPGSGL